MSAPQPQSRAAANSYLSAQHGQNISLPYDHDIIPCQMVQMGASGALFYVNASYSFGLQYPLLAATDSFKSPFQP